MRTFGSRSSPLTSSKRSAANPANALLNNLYATLEAEARCACLTLALDPGMGVLYDDLKERDSLARDLMKAVRPQVDTFVLQILETHTFAARDFFETRQGACRLMSPLTHLLAETQARWAKAVAPVAEAVMRALFRPEHRSAQRDRRVPTRLTGANRSAGRDGVRRQAMPLRACGKITTSGLPRVRRAARGCGPFILRRLPAGVASGIH